MKRAIIEINFYSFLKINLYKEDPALEIDIFLYIYLLFDLTNEHRACTTMVTVSNLIAHNRK